MSGKLEWTCPICGVTLKLPQNVERFECTCRSRFDRSGQVLRAAAPEIPQWQVEQRQTTCQMCAHFARQRCTLIDYGCRRRYSHELFAMAGSCPLGLWLRQQQEQH